MTDVLDLFVSFLRASILGFGGGPSMVLLIQSEVVDLHGWLSNAEFLDAFAFGNALPSPIATKLAAFTGYHVAGWPGAFAALLGVAGPTAALVILAAGLFMSRRNNPVLKAIIAGVRPVVVALLLYVVWDFLVEVFGTELSSWLANWYLLAIAVASGWLMQRYRVHPVPLIIGGGLVGMLVAVA